MKYKLYDNNDIHGNIVEQVLKNRGISDPKSYLSINSSYVLPYNLLCNMDKAIQLYTKHFNDKNTMSVLIDEDVDGMCSAAIVYLYTKRIGGKDYPINYILHNKAKAHGLTDGTEIPKDTKLLIIPDAGTNDKKYLYKLMDNGIDILILDHHELEEEYKDGYLHNENNETVIVNNQMSDLYTNKDLCGAGIVYKFFKALDEYLWNEYADDYLDLVALANISDIMDMRSYETKYYVDLGLSNINNKLFDALIKSQDYSIKGNINIKNIQWSITPIINGCIRVGSHEEKELLFRAFIEQDEFFEYKKRATKDKPSETIQESIYDKAARLSKNAKARQDKAKEKGVQAIIDYIEKNNNDNKVTVIDTTKLLDNELSGLVAIKIAEMYNKPCLLLNSHFDKKNNIETFGGSARNFNNSPIESFKDIVNSTSFAKGKGHANAFGIISLYKDNLNDFIDELNNILKDVEYDSTYRVDFKLDIDDVDLSTVSSLTSIENLIGTGISEPMIFIENIYMNKNNFEIIGKTEDTIKFIYNDVEYIMFKCKENNQLYSFLQDAWNDDENVTFNIVGKAQWNEFEGIKKPQIQIIDVEITDTSLNNDNEEDIW